MSLSHDIQACQQKKQQNLIIFQKIQLFLYFVLFFKFFMGLWDEMFMEIKTNTLKLSKIEKKNREDLIILCGHYKGIDHRIREHLITREISCGDYVLSGGELPAAILADSIIRLIPGALTDETSALSDCFQDGLLSAPIYTRPAEFNGWKVPDVLLSGNPKLIREWQDEQAIERTKRLRPALLSEK